MKIERKSSHEVFSPASYDDPDGVAYRVVACVAELTDVSPMDLPPLTDSVDPDALAGVVESTSEGNCSIVFPFAGAQVNVVGNGDVYAFIPQFSGPGSKN
ncbi:HalOD1 output domain-containing protein [Haloferax namakaokahaiae]|uniref:HalOD1 output domain-containing protein n=1 Tax=Haloferax namakaokahaiae TaxID=1748331 RepID=A0ABD5ZKE8_9EURY